MPRQTQPQPRTGLSGAGGVGRRRLHAIGRAVLSLVGIDGASVENSRYAKLALGTSGMFAAMTVLGVASNILLARLLGPEWLGIYATAFSLASFLAVLTSTGVPEAVIRLLAIYRAEGKEPLLRGCLVWAYAQVITVGTIGAAAIALLLLAMGHPLGPRAEITSLLALALLPMWGVMGVQSGILQGIDRVVAARIPDLLFRPGSFVLFLLLWFVFDHQIRPTDPAAWAMAANVAAFLVALTIGAVVVRRLASSAMPASPRAYEFKRWYRMCIAMTTTGVAQAAIGQCALILSPMFATPAEVGFLRVALTTSVLATLPYTAIMIPMAARLSRYCSEDRWSLLQNTLTSANRIGFISSFPLSVALLLMGPTILSILYGNEYRGAYPILFILTLGQLAYITAGMSGLVLRFSGHEKLEAQLTASFAVLQVALTLLIAHFAGALGAALAHAISNTLLVIALIYAALRKANVHTTVMGSNLSKR